MLKRILKWVAFIISAIIVVSMANSLLTYRIDRRPGVQYGKYSEYCGVVGIQTKYSDGVATYRQIGKTCDSLRLDFAIITDINTIQPMKADLSNRFGMTLMIPAVEISTDSLFGHFLVIGDSIPLLPGKGISVDSVRHDALRKGDMVILTRLPKHFQGLIPRKTGFTGFEVYNFAKGWRSNLDFFRINKFIGAYCIYGFRPQVLNYLLAYPDREMHQFDQLNMSGKVTGIGCLNANGNLMLWKNTRWSFPSYTSQFELLHDIIVTKTPFSGSYWPDREILLDALRRGNYYVAFSGLEPARGFLFTAESGKSSVTMGDSIKLSGDVKLSVSLPDTDLVTTQIVRDGKVIRTYEDIGSVTLTVSTPGVYRVQVFQHRVMLPFFTKRSFPWILSNPIYVYR